MLWVTLHCCIICRNSGVYCNLTLTLLHFMQDLSVRGFYWPALLYILQDFSKMLRTTEHGDGSLTHTFSAENKKRPQPAEAGLWSLILSSCLLPNRFERLGLAGNSLLCGEALDA